MKFNVFSESREEKEKEVNLMLRNNYDGTVNVIAVDDSGDRLDGGTLITFMTNGRILLLADVNEDLGFALDDYDRIIAEKE